MKDKFNDFASYLRYLKESVGETDEEGSPIEDDVTVDEFEPTDGVDAAPNDENVLIDIFPKVNPEVEMESVTDILAVLREYFIEIGLEIMEIEDKIVIPFKNRAIVIAITPTIVEGSIIDLLEKKESSQKGGVEFCGAMETRDFGLDFVGGLNKMFTGMI